MNNLEWDELNTRFSKEFAFWNKLGTRVRVVRDVARLYRLVVDALMLAEALNLSRSSKGRKPKFRYYDGVEELTLGPARLILCNLPDPAIFRIEDCAQFYVELMAAASKKRVPAEFFLLACDYATRLLGRMGNSHLADTRKNAELEAQFRNRLLRKDCLKLIIHEEQTEHPLRIGYRQSLVRTADAILRQGDYGGVIQSLLSELDQTYDLEAANIADVDYERMLCLHYYNFLLGVLPASELLPSKYMAKVKLTESQRKEIKRIGASSASEAEIRQLHMYLSTGAIQADARTRITIVVPTKWPEGCFAVGGWDVTSTSITSAFDDPNFRILHRRRAVINGMPLAVLSPALEHGSPATLLNFEFKKPFHPEICVNSDGEVSAPIFRDSPSSVSTPCDPYIAKIEELLSAIEDGIWPSSDQITATLKLTGGFAVQYIGSNDNPTYQFFRAVTKLSVFLDARDRFVNIFEQVFQSTGNRGKRLKDLAVGPQLTDVKGLRKFTTAVLEELIVWECQHEELWKMVWTKKNGHRKIKLEPEVQREIFSKLKTYFLVRGLSFDKEVAAAGGAIDFLVTGMGERWPIRCGIELKYAHHAKILESAAVQLPAYLDGLEAEAGIILVLWCKGEKFDKPKAYDTYSDLAAALIDRVPAGKDISIVTANASYKSPPSKRRISKS